MTQNPKMKERTGGKKGTTTPPSRHRQVSCSFSCLLNPLRSLHRKEGSLPCSPVASNIGTGGLSYKPPPPNSTEDPLRPRRLFLTGEFERVYEFMLEVNFLISSLGKYQGIYFSYVISRESVMWPDFYSVGLLRDLTVKRSPLVRMYPRTDLSLQRNLTIPGRKRVKSQ